MQGISGRKLGTLTSYRHVRAILLNFETLDPWVVGQQAARDIYAGGAGEGGSNPDDVDWLTPLAKHCNLSSMPAACNGTY